MMIARVCVVLVVMTAVARAETAKPEPALGEDESLYSCRNRTGEVAVTFKPETEVSELITWVMGFTCKNFVLDPRVVVTNKKVTIIAPNKLDHADAYRLFLTALQTINLTIVPKGKVIRIVDAPTARRETVPLYKSGSPDGSDQVVRYVYRPSYAPVETLVQTFTALKSDAGDVQLVGTLVMITDYGSHVKDMMSLAKLVDVPKGSDGIYTIPVKHADATKLADKLGNILGLTQQQAAPSKPEPMKAPVAAAAPSKILVDERTNTLIVAASEAGYERVKALVERLDISLDIEGGASFHVYKLGSAIAEELAKTMNDAITGQQQQQPKAGAPKPAVPALENLGAALEGQARVISDKATNSLIIVSSGRDFLSLRQIIRELDLPRRQVYIEAMILELAINDETTVGTSSHGVVPVAGTSLLLGGARTGVDTSSVESIAKVTGLVAGAFGSPVTFLGQSIPSYGVLFQAIANTGRTNVLSAPSIIAVDNELAKYNVGVDIGYKAGAQVTFPGSGAVSGGTVERKKIGIELEIKPHISADDTVLLELKHEAADLLVADGPYGPTWSSRSFDTRVIVKDQESVVIGGLIQEKSDVTTRKVPLLGDIPILGHLFKSTTTIKKKTNLVILLTPYIIKDQLDLRMIRERKLREHDEYAKSVASLDRMRYEPRMNYARKRGLVEDINRTILEVDADLAARAALKPPSAVKPGPIEIPAAVD